MPDKPNPPVDPAKGNELLRRMLGARTLPIVPDPAPRDPAPAFGKQPSPKKTGLVLVNGSDEEFDLWAYPFPETKGEPFDLIVNGEWTKAARTQGIGKKMKDVRHYSYFVHDGISMYVERKLPADSRVTVRSR